VRPGAALGWNLVVTISRASPTTGCIDSLPRGRSYDGLQASLPQKVRPNESAPAGTTTAHSR